MTWLSKGVSFAKKTVSKGLAFSSKVADIASNPIGAASKLLQSGAASKSGTPKKSSLTKSEPTTTPSKTMAFDESTWYGRIWVWIKENWIYILVFGIILTTIIWLYKRNKKKAAGRRRTFAARRARVANRRTHRRRAPRKK